MDVGDLVAGRKQDSDIACESRRLAGYVGDASRLNSCEPVERRAGHSVARRVKDDEFGFFFESLEETLDIGGPHFNRAAASVRFKVTRGCGVRFDGDYTLELFRE